MKAFYGMNSSSKVQMKTVRKKTIQEEGCIALETKLLCLAGGRESEAPELKMKANYH